MKFNKTNIELNDYSATLLSCLESKVGQNVEDTTPTIQMFTSTCQFCGLITYLIKDLYQSDRKLQKM